MAALLIGAGSLVSYYVFLAVMAMLAGGLVATVTDESWFISSIVSFFLIRICIGVSELFFGTKPVRCPVCKRRILTSRPVKCVDCGGPARLKE